MSDPRSTMLSSRSHRDAEPVGYASGLESTLPPGAAEPMNYPYKKFSQFKSNNSSYTLLHHEIHTSDPLIKHAQLIASPTQMSAQLTFDQRYGENPAAPLRDVLLHVLRKTSPWVLVGVVIMLAGIGLFRGLILPRIHTCPVSAACSGWDPNKGNSLQLLQSFTVYWIKVGLIVASVGLLKLSAYQAWFILMHKGNSVKNLDLTLGAIRGSITDAAILLLQKNTLLLSALVFALLGISAAINLIVGLSIGMASETQSVVFTFNGTTQLPDSSLATIGNDGQLKAMEKMVVWSLDNDQNHGGALKGTLVTPDARSSQASNALPGGPTIRAWFECQPWNNYTAVPETERGWYIWIHETRFTALPEMSLAVSMYRVDTAVTEYLWVSNRTGLIPNATTTSDGGMNMALCTHYYEMLPEGPRKPGVQYLIPTVALTSGCDGHDTNVCIADSVNNAVLNWWGGGGTDFWDMSCRGGLLGPISPASDAQRYCPLTQELFQETASGMLDAIIQTAPLSVTAVQELEANVNGLDGSKWWLNVTIPAAALIIYLIGLAYTCIISQGDIMLKELNLEEVVRAAQTDHMHQLVSSGEFRTIPLRYRGDIGFVGSPR